MKKIIISLLLFLTPTICFAKTIKINNINYNVDSVLELDGVKYDSLNDTITLNNANITNIQTDEDLKVILIGNNTITNNRTVSECIRGKHVQIEGNGTLNLICNSRGIYANTLEITNTTIYGDVLTSMFVITGTDTNMIINNSNVIFKSKSIGFNIVDGDLLVKDSNVIISNIISLGGDTINNINIVNSNLDIVESEMVLNNQKLYIDNDSKVFMYSKNGIKIDCLVNSISYLGSSDNVNYHDGILTEDKYLKVNIDNKLDEYNNLLKEKEYLEKENIELKNKEKEINYLENELNNKNNELESKKIELLELDESLSIKEEELMNKEKKLNDSNNEVLSLTNSIEALNNILTSKDNELNNMEFDIEKERNEIDSLKRYISLKEKELKEKEDNLLLKTEENNDKLIDYSNVKDKEVLDDDFMENSISYNKQNVGILNKFGNILYLIISYIGGIITHIFTKRRLNG